MGGVVFSNCEFQTKTVATRQRELSHGMYGSIGWAPTCASDPCRFDIVTRYVDHICECRRHPLGGDQSKVECDYVSAVYFVVRA